MMHGRGKSDSVVVAGKPMNKAERSAAELVEPRAETKGKASQQSTCRAQYRESVSQALAAYAKLHQRGGVRTRGGSPVRESRTPGSVRGARGNSRPYRDTETNQPDIAGSVIRLGEEAGRPTMVPRRVCR